MDDFVAIVPARGGSVGILRKNLRVVDGKPLVLHKLLALRYAGIGRIVCSTNDPIIAAVARIHGFEVHERTMTAGPEATVAETAQEALGQIGHTGPVGIFQVTSPGIRPERIRAEIEDFLADDTLQTAASVRAIHDVCYTPDERILYPDGGNRQDQKQPACWAETGGIRLYREAELVGLGQDPTGHKLIELDGPEAIDIDDHGHLAAVRQAMHRSRVTFVAAVGTEVGSGHLHRCLTLADELAHHDIRFRLSPGPGWSGVDPDAMAAAAQMVTDSGYTLDGPGQQAGAGLHVFDVLEADPRIVAEVAAHDPVVLLEDQGPACPLASVVVNELYDTGDAAGPAFAVLRPEFLVDGPHAPTFSSRAGGGRVLVCFGGTDPLKMGPAVVEELRGTFPHMGVTLYGGLGLPGKDRIPIAEAMATHDILVTACGRTVYEAARVGIPTISIPVNAREATHVRLPSVHYLDRAEMALGQVAGAVEALYRAPRLRREMSETGRALVDGRGAQRIARMIDNLSEGLL